MGADAAPLTDLHTHILPDIDDGASDLEEATAIARVALAEGIGCLAATPHSLQWPPGTGLAAIAARVQELEEHLREQDVPLRVVAGAELALIAALPQQIDAGEAITLNRSNYLLVELDYSGVPPELEETVFQIQVRGYVPVLALPERNAGLQRHPDRLRTLVERGLLLQITAGSLEGLLGPAAQKAAWQLLRANMVHVIASDAHSARGRAPHLRRAEELAAQVIGAERAHALVADHPAAILAGQPLEAAPPRPAERRWRHALRRA